MTAPELIAETDGPVLRVWLNRPARLNALTVGVLEELIGLFGSLRSRREVRVVVLGGVGRSFSAGADRDMLNDARSSHGIPPGQEAWWIADLGRRAARAIEDAAAVTVARLHGHVVGGAAVLALACDFRIAADDTLIWLPEVSLGIPLTWGGLPRLIQETGAARARQLVLAGDKIGAEAGERWGLLHAAVPPARLDAEVDALPARLASQPALAVAQTKAQLRALSAAPRTGELPELDADLLSRAMTAGVEWPPKPAGGTPADEGDRDTGSSQASEARQMPSADDR